MRIVATWLEEVGAYLVEYFVRGENQPFHIELRENFCEVV